MSARLLSPKNRSTNKRPRPSSAAPALTAEGLQQQLKSVDELKDVDDDTKAKIRDVYKRALQHLTEAEGFRARSVSFASMAATAEERTGTVRFEVSATQANVTIDPPKDATLQQLTQLQQMKQVPLSRTRRNAKASWTLNQLGDHSVASKSPNWKTRHAASSSSSPQN